MTGKKIDRRTFVGATAGAASTLALGGRALAQGLQMPKAPIVLTVVDAAGHLALTQPIFENYRTANPSRVSASSSLTHGLSVTGGGSARTWR